MHGCLEIPDDLSDPFLKEIYYRSELAAMPEYLRITYINYIMSRNDELNSRAEMLEDALAEGYAKGVEIGRAEGHEDGRRWGLAEGREAGLAEGREAGLAEGREAGLVEGCEAAKISLAKKLKDLNVDIHTIVAATELDVDFVRSL